MANFPIVRAIESIRQTEYACEAHNPGPRRSWNQSQALVVGTRQGATVIAGYRADRTQVGERPAQGHLHFVDQAIRLLVVRMFSLYASHIMKERCCFQNAALFRDGTK
jgi:hypothetical protein